MVICWELKSTEFVSPKICFEYTAKNELPTDKVFLKYIRIKERCLEITSGVLDGHTVARKGLKIRWQNLHNQWDESIRVNKEQWDLRLEK